MLVTILLLFPKYIVGWVFSLFPIIAIPVGVTQAVVTATSDLWTLSSFIPITTLMAAVSVILLTEFYILQWKFWRWVLSYIPFFGGHGV